MEVALTNINNENIKVTRDNGQTTITIIGESVNVSMGCDIVNVHMGCDLSDFLKNPLDNTTPIEITNNRTNDMFISNENIKIENIESEIKELQKDARNGRASQHKHHERIQQLERELTQLYQDLSKLKLSIE